MNENRICKIYLILAGIFFAIGAFYGFRLTVSFFSDMSATEVLLVKCLLFCGGIFSGLLSTGFAISVIVVVWALIFFTIDN